MYQILLVEDDEDLATITQVHLVHAGYRTDIAHSCQEATTLLARTEYDLVLLDMLLPDGDGNSLCVNIRCVSQCPIIFISCLDDNNTVVSALGVGGDDYVPKPIKYEVLLARIEANLRRHKLYDHTQKEPPQNEKRFRHFIMDTLRHQALVDGVEVGLSVIEYSLLLYMTEHPDTLLLYEELYRSVWKNDSLGDVRTVMVHISNLRKKIDPGHFGLIQTVRGAGYIFTDV